MNNKWFKLATATFHLGVAGYAFYKAYQQFKAE